MVDEWGYNILLFLLLDIFGNFHSVIMVIINHHNNNDNDSITRAREMDGWLSG